MKRDSLKKPELPECIWRHLRDPRKKTFAVYLLPRTDKPGVLRVTPYSLDSPYLNNIEAAYINTHCVGTYAASFDLSVANQIFNDIEYVRGCLKGVIAGEGE